jgi:hypothetical protein
LSPISREHLPANGPPSPTAVTPGEDPPSPDTSRTALTAVTWTTCFGLVATLLYFYGLHSDWGNADLVRGVMQGADIAKGNVLLNHWSSSADNFLTIDLPFFTLGVLIVGQKVVLLHLVSCLLWTALIFAGGYIAGTGLKRSTRFWTMVAVLVVLGLPCPLLAQALSQTMVHVGTCLYVLLAFIALRTGRFGRSWYFAVVLLTASTFGDPLTIAFGLAPPIGVGILESIRERDWRRGIPTSSAPIVALVAAGLLRLVTDHIGTFVIYSDAPLASPSGIAQNLRSFFPALFSLLGLGPSLRGSGVPWELEISRSFGLVAVMIGVAVATWSLLRGVLSGRRRSDVRGLAGRGDASFRLSGLLVLGFLGDAVLYVILGLPGSALHYLTPGVIFAAILGAMFLGHFIQQISSRRALHVLTAAAVLIAGCCASCVAIVLTDAVPTSPYSEVGTFLAAHHLYTGLGDYWTSAPITVYTEGKVTVRQVTPFYTGGIQPYLVLAKTTWYTGTFQFLIYSLNESAYGVTQHYGLRIRQSSDYPFSQVAHTYNFLSFRIVVWKRPQTIADLEYPVQPVVGFASLQGQALPGLPVTNWPKLSPQSSDQMPLFAAAGLTSSSHGLSDRYEVSLYSFVSRRAETDFYENDDLALSYVIPAGATIAPLDASTGVSGTSEGFNLIECAGSSSVEPGEQCTGNVKPSSAGVVTVFRRGSTVAVITYVASGQRAVAPAPGELTKNVDVAQSVISLLASAGIR